jgi:hypothetical protein
MQRNGDGLLAGVAGCRSQHSGLGVAGFGALKGLPGFDGAGSAGQQRLHLGLDFCSCFGCSVVGEGEAQHALRSIWQNNVGGQVTARLKRVTSARRVRMLMEVHCWQPALWSQDRHSCGRSKALACKPPRQEDRHCCWSSP